MGLLKKWGRKLKKSIKDLGRNIQRIVDDVTDREWYSYLEDEMKAAYRSMMEHVLKEQMRWARKLGIDEWGNEDFQKWLHMHGPFVVFAADATGLGLGVVHNIWDKIFKERTFVPFGDVGGFNPEKVGYLIERSYEISLADILGNPDPEKNAGGGATSFFVGHLPECVFDELTISQNGPAFESYGTYEGAEFGEVGVYAFQIRRVAGIDDGPVFVPISGTETSVDAEAPELILRETLKQPWKHPDRFSETYGGPVTALDPTFVGVYARGLTGTPGLDEWYANITIRFLARPTE